jgi:hypothetical protein
MKAQTNNKNFAASDIVGTEAQRRHVREPLTDDYNPFAIRDVFSKPKTNLCLAIFKCNRADIYYIPESVPQVMIGDSVIVEGDRGQDLGTIEQIKCSVEQAMHFKEAHTQKHFRILMMFSRLFPRIAAIAGDDQAFANSLIDGGPGSTIQGMCTESPQFSKDIA